MLGVNKLHDATHQAADVRMIDGKIVIFAPSVIRLSRRGGSCYPILLRAIFLLSYYFSYALPIWKVRFELLSALSHPYVYNLGLASLEGGRAWKRAARGRCRQQRRQRRSRSKYFAISSSSSAYERGKERTSFFLGHLKKEGL